jgi:hypothetical protein
MRTAIPGQRDLADAIADAARRSFADLFSENPGSYYYCTLVTTGQAHSPVVSAWSEEALDLSVAQELEPALVREEIRWSAADSPYCAYGESYFAAVGAMFERRPRLTPAMTRNERDAEYELRLSAMETAMVRIPAHSDH